MAGSDLRGASLDEGESYFDCFAGVSGDMIIGALIDLGVDLEALKQQLSSLELDRI